MRILDFSDGFESSVEPTSIAISADAVSVDPSGNLSSTDVQAALEELQGDVDTINSSLPNKVDAITSVDNTLPRFNGTSGQIQESGITIDDSDNVTGVKNLTATGTTQNLGTSNTASTINIGTGTGANTINIGGGNTTVNITGSLNNENVTNLTVTDKLVTLNKGAGTGSGGSAGIEIEENSSITGYIETSTDRNSWQFKAPNTAGITSLTPGSSNDDIALLAKSQTLTNKTLSGNTATNLISGSGTLTLNTSGTVTLPNATDTLVGKATTDTLTNKTLTGPVIDAIVFDDQSSTPSNPSAGFYKVYVKSDGNAYKLDSSGNETQIGAGGGGLIGDRELISNTNIESNATGYSAYADAAGAMPVDGTGGSPNSTIARNTTNPISGTGDLIWTKSGSANRQGEGFSIPFTVGKADQAKALQIEFDYIVASGTFVAGSQTTDSDMEIYIYDVTNSVLIQPSNYKLLSNSSSISEHFKANFQTSSNGTSYRLIFHTATTSTSNYAVQFDNISVHPSKYVYGSPVTDPVAYTPTFTSFGTVSGVKVEFQQVGKYLEVQGSVVPGTVTSSFGSISLPPGLSIDTNVITNNNTTSNAGQICGWIACPGGANNTFLTTATATNAGVVYVSNLLSAVAGVAIPASSLSGIWGSNGNGVVIPFWFRVPIAGWSSSVQMSSDTDTRVVAASAYVSSNYVTSAGQAINFDTVLFDTHGAITTGSANTWKFTVPVPGYYAVKAVLSSTSGTGNQLQLYKNGSQASNFFTYGSTNVLYSGSVTVKCNAGDTLSANPGGGITAAGNTGTNPFTLISIERVSGPATIAATETIAASYWVSTNFAATTSVPINFDSKEYDTHNAVTPSATVWVFTAPVPGIYQASFVGLGSTTGKLLIYKNNSAYKFLSGITNGSSGIIGAAGTTSLRLNAADTIQFRPDQNITFTGGTLATGGVCNITITRVGN